VARCCSWELRAIGSARCAGRRVRPLELLEVSGLKRVGLMAVLRGLLRLPNAFFSLIVHFGGAFRPDAVLGVGGYASGPVVPWPRRFGLPHRDSRTETASRIPIAFCRDWFGWSWSPLTKHDGSFGA